MRHGESGFRLVGEAAAAGERRARLEIGLADGERQRTVDGKRTSLAEHLAVLPVVAWTTGDVEVLTGPPVERRRFLDRGVVGVRPLAIETLARYRRTLGQKRQLLARGGRGGLESWNALLASAAVEVATQRAAYVGELESALEAIVALCQLDLPPVRLRYRPSPAEALDGAAATERALAAATERERALGQPLVGPHRDELVVRWGGRPVKRVASAGERKLLAMALLAAQARILEQRGRQPVVLLDDADAELDAGRLRALWRAFAGARQLVATSSRPEVWEGVSGLRRWRCEGGRLEP